MPFSILIPVGPSDVEVTRTREVLDSVFAYEPSVQRVMLLDDGPADRDLSARLAVPREWPTEIFRNPRDRRSLGLWGGLAFAMMSALRRINSYGDTDFVIKIDSDALVIAPFAEKLHAAFESHPDVGNLGSLNPNASGKDQKWGWTFWGDTFNKLRKRYAYWPDAPKQKRRTRLFGAGRVICNRIDRAFANGYIPGEHCAGGSYAMHRRFLDRMESLGWWDDAKLWQWICMGEDPLMGMYTRAAGFKMLSLVRPGEPFAIEWKGLCGPPQWLVDNGYSLIHSVKNDPNFTEGQIVDFFRARRTV